MVERDALEQDEEVAVRVAAGGARHLERNRSIQVRALPAGRQRQLSQSVFEICLLSPT